MVERIKTYKVDFYVVTKDQERDHDRMEQLLHNGKDHTEALQLDPKDDDKHQIRSIVKGSGTMSQAVFGRCRFGDKPVQGTLDGREEELKLKAGHGLVEKNHFLFFADRNLIVYQRNGSGSHYVKLQRYLNKALSANIGLEPILTTNAYQRLLSQSGNTKRVELSFQRPKDPSLYKDLWTKEAIQLVRKVGGVNARIVISTGRSPVNMADQIKFTAVAAARAGLASVAKVRIDDEMEPIDLIADRIIDSISVKVGDNGRPESASIYQEMYQAYDRQRPHLRTFFGASE